MSRPFLSRLYIPLENELLVNPILNWYTLIKKLRPLVIPGTYFPIKIYSCTYSLPIFLPEIGCMVALDLVSESLKREIEEKKTEYESFYSKNQVMLSKLYNFDASVNRVVSWGRYSFHRISEDIYHVYIVNLINDLLLFPSILTEFGPYSPVRWFWVSGGGHPEFKTIVCYNVSIVYLKKEFLTRHKKLKLWLGEPINIYGIQCGYIQLSGTGYVKFRKFPIFTVRKPDELSNEIDRRGGYYICFSVGLCGYRTNYSNSTFTRIKFYINIIDSLLPLVHSPYDIAPFLFPYFINKEDIVSRICTVDIPESVIKSILKRFEKFGMRQSLEMVEDYNKVFEKMNQLVRVKKVDDKIRLTVVNPSVVPFLIRKYLSSTRHFSKKCAKIVLENDDFISQLKAEHDFNVNMAMKGFKRISEFRKENFTDYIDSFQGLQLSNPLL